MTEYCLAGFASTKVHHSRVSTIIRKKDFGLMMGLIWYNKTGVWRVGSVQCVREEGIKRKYAEEIKKES